MLCLTAGRRGFLRRTAQARGPDQPSDVISSTLKCSLQTRQSRSVFRAMIDFSRSPTGAFHTFDEGDTTGWTGSRKSLLGPCHHSCHGEPRIPHERYSVGALAVGSCPFNDPYVALGSISEQLARGLISRALKRGACVLNTVELNDNDA